MVKETRLPLWTKILLGMCLGMFLPILLVFQGGVFNEEFILRAMMVGTVFGGFMAYFLDRLRRVERTRGELVWLLASSGMAGVATAAAAYDLGYLHSVWHVALGGVGGAVLVGGWWVYANWN